jgi:hypothetical protein
MYWNAARRHERADNGLKRKDCRKKEEIGDFILQPI